MAIDYPTLFADIGTFITAIDQLRDTAVQLNSPRPDLIALEEDHQDTLTDTTVATDRGRFAVLSGLDVTYDSIRDTVIAQCDRLASYVTTRLLDEKTVIDNLPGMGAGPSIDRVLVELHNDMINTSQTILQSTVTIGSQTPDADNRGDGVVFTTKRLDGETPPGSDLENSILYTGIDSELTVQSEELLWTCTGDQFDSGASDGGEAWQLESRQRRGSRFTWRTEGSGESFGISTANESNQGFLANQDFENWTDSTTLNDWTVETGGVAQSGGNDKFRGDFGAFMSQFTRISQEISGLQPRTMYCVTIAHKAINPATPIQMYMVGTLSDGSPYVATGEERLDTQIGTAWAQSAIFYLVPDEPMVDAKLIVEAGNTLYIDSMTYGPVTWIGGVGTVIVAGEAPWVTGDRVRLTISNDDAGRFQRFWRKWYRRQLPSSSSPTIAEPAL